MRDFQIRRTVEVSEETYQDIQKLKEQAIDITVERFGAMFTNTVRESLNDDMVLGAAVKAVIMSGAYKYAEIDF
jgi:hypothetical protein